MSASITRVWPPEKLSDLIGIPFLFGGRDAEGIDCEGVVRFGLRLMFGIDVPDSGDAFLSAYHRGNISIPSCFPEADWQVLPADDPTRPGDVLVVGRGGVAQHVALVLHAGLVLQATENALSCILRIDRMRRLVAVVRHR